MADADVYDLPDMGELYDAVRIYQTRRDVDFWVDAARAAGGRTLELGCGTGRVLLPLARAGLEVTGLDRSAGMLDRCRANLAREPDDVRARARLHEADMREFDLGERYAAVLAPFRSFQHLTTIDDQLRALRAIHRHVDDGGRLVFDVFNPNYHYLVDPRRSEEREDTPDTPLPDGRRFRRTARVVEVRAVEQISQVEIAYYITDASGRTDRVAQAFPMRWYTRAEIEHLLARTGFALRQVYGDYDSAPLTDGSPEMVVVAERQ